MKQTAVEWYIEKLLDLDYEYGKGLITLAVWSERKKSLIEQAKEMEKERIISAQMDMFHFLNNLKFGMMYIEKREEAEKFAEQWYNETF